MDRSISRRYGGSCHCERSEIVTIIATQSLTIDTISVTKLTNAAHRRVHSGCGPEDAASAVPSGGGRPPRRGSRWSAARRRAPEAGGSRKRIVLWRAPRPKRERVATFARVAWPTTLAPLGAPLLPILGGISESLKQSSGADASRERRRVSAPAIAGQDDE